MALLFRKPVRSNKKTFKEESFDEKVYKQYLTGYGLGAMVLFKHEVYSDDVLNELDLGYVKEVLNSITAKE